MTTQLRVNAIYTILEMQRNSSPYDVVRSCHLLIVHNIENPFKFSSNHTKKKSQIVKKEKKIYSQFIHKLEHLQSIDWLRLPTGTPVVFWHWIICNCFLLYILLRRNRKLFDCFKIFGGEKCIDYLLSLHYLWWVAGECALNFAIDS